MRFLSATPINQFPCFWGESIYEELEFFGIVAGNDLELMVSCIREIPENPPVVQEHNTLCFGRPRVGAEMVFIEVGPYGKSLHRWLERLGNVVGKSKSGGGRKYSKNKVTNLPSAALDTLGDQQIDKVERNYQGGRYVEQIEGGTDHICAV